MGELLGFKAIWPDSDEEGKAQPDGVWILGDRLAITFEVKSEKGEAGTLYVHDIRQAQSHPSWLKQYCKLPPSAKILNVVISTTMTIDKDAVRMSEGIKFVNIREVQRLADRAVSVMTRVRNAMGENQAPEQLITTILSEVEKSSAGVHSILKILENNGVDALTIKK
ncbi:MAG: hypothetical protein PSY14_16590 [bacterium]|nr:hypothetical protein [bacterium]